MNFLALKYFTEVAEEHSFTRAAEKLHISQQSLSQHIKRLEDYYQVALFERKPVLRLTYAGQLILNYAKDVNLAEEQIFAELSFIRNNEKGKIVLGTTPSRSPVFVCQLLTKFKQRYPNIELSLKESYTSHLEELLLNGEIDVLVGNRCNDEQYNQNFKIFELLHDKNIYLLVSDKLLEQCYPEHYTNRQTLRRGIELEHLIGLPVALNSKTSRIHSQIEQYYLGHGSKPNILIESNNVVTMLPFCEQGQLAIIVSELLLHTLLNQDLTLEKRLNIFPITDCFMKTITVLMFHKDKPISRHLTDLIEITEGSFRAFEAETPRCIVRIKGY